MGTRVKQIEISRIEAKQFREALGMAAAVSKHAHDNKAMYRRFKIVCGVNADLFKDIEAATKEDLAELEKGNEGYFKYRAALADVEKEFNPDGLESYQPPQEVIDQIQARVKALNAEYAAAIQKARETVERRDAYLSERLVVSVAAYPYDEVPYNLSGGFVWWLRWMLDGVPEDILATAEKAAKEMDQDDAADEPQKKVENAIA